MESRSTLGSVKPSVKIVNSIARLTAVDDIELVTFSFLHSIQNVVNCEHLSVVHIDPLDRIQGQYLVQNDKNEYKQQSVTLSNIFQNSLEQLLNSKEKEYAKTIEGNQYLSFIVNRTANTTQVLQLQTTSQLAPDELLTIKSLIDIYKNFSTLILNAQTDELTGLLNRKTFDKAIATFWEESTAHRHIETERRAANEEANNYIIVFDIDHFKSINDNYGHLFGDEVLILVANQLRRSFRSDDLLFRFGGEEFVLLLKNINKEDCESLLSKVHTDIASTDFPNVEKLTISSGGCAISDGSFYMSVLDYADKALYQSKANGRDQYTLYEKPPEEEEQESFTGEIDLF